MAAVREEVGRLDLLYNAVEIPEMPWMIILGWYVMVMMHMDFGATAAT
jgi:hypothetical protein